MKQEKLSTGTIKLSLGSLFIGTIVALNLFPLLFIGSRFPTIDNIWKSSISVFILTLVLLKLGTRLRAPRSYILFLLVIVSYQLVNPLINGDFPLNIKDLISLSYLPLTYFLYFVALGRQKMTELEVYSFLKYFILFCVILCTYNFVINLDTIKSLSVFVRPYDINFASIFANRNIFAFYLYTASAANIFLLQKETRSKILVASMSILLVSLILTLSRTSIIALAVFTVVYVFLAYGLNSLIKLLAIFGSISLLVFRSDTAKMLITTNLVRAQAGLSGRNIAYAYAQKLLANHNPIFGVGYFRSLENLKAETGLSHFHNSYLTVYMYGGLSLMFLYITAICFGALKSLSVYKNKKQLGSFLVAYILSYIAYSLTESTPLFGPAATNYIATVFVILIPLYVVNNLKTMRVKS